MCFPCFVFCVNDIDVADGDDRRWEFIIMLNLRFYRFHDTREILGEQRT